MFRRSAIVALCAVAASAFAAPQRPFPQHVALVPGAIIPSHKTRAQLDDDVRRYYDAWKARYPTANPPDQYYNDVHGGAGPTANTVTVSEAHGYAMVIVALMAGYDPDAQTIFDGLYRYFRAHPANDPQHQLMAWYQVRSGGQIVDGELYNATDGDLDVAYALLLADQQWGSGGAIDYLQEARTVIGASLAELVNPTLHSVLTAWDPINGDASSTRTSDFMIDHFRAFGAASGDARWTDVVNECLAIDQTIQTNDSPTTGLLPDFVVHLDTTPTPAGANTFESSYDGDYYYNAARDPWRLGADYVLFGDAREQSILAPLNAFIRGAAGNVPAGIQAGYRLGGTPIGNYEDTAFIAPLTVGAMAGAANQSWLNALWDYLAGDLTATNYFGDNLKMQVMIVASGNWWAPQVGGGNRGPDVQLTSPVDGATFQAPATIALEATASDPDPGGTVAKVEFYADTTKIGEDATSPYQLSWTPVGPGTYRLTAHATDDVGAITVSAPATIRVLTCPSAPRSGCAGAKAAGASLAIKQATPDARDAVSWKWQSAAPVALSDYGTPTATTDLGFCVYDATGLVLAAAVPAGGTCAGRPCWQATTVLDRYADRDGTPDGVQKMTLRAGTTGRITVKGKGTHLPLPSLPLAPPLRVQVTRVDGGGCWESIHTMPGVNDGTTVKARSD